jgi:hypothetical protein
LRSGSGQSRDGLTLGHQRALLRLLEPIGVKEGGEAASPMPLAPLVRHPRVAKGLLDPRPAIGEEDIQVRVGEPRFEVRLDRCPGRRRPRHGLSPAAVASPAGAGAQAPHVAHHPTIFAGDFPSNRASGARGSPTVPMPLRSPGHGRAGSGEPGLELSGGTPGRAVNESKELAHFPGPWHPHWAARERPPGDHADLDRQGSVPPVVPP